MSALRRFDLRLLGFDTVAELSNTHEPLQQPLFVPRFRQIDLVGHITAHRCRCDRIADGQHQVGNHSTPSAIASTWVSIATFAWPAAEPLQLKVSNMVPVRSIWQNQVVFASRTRLDRINLPGQAIALNDAP